jgi:hypothetical protein
MSMSSDRSIDTSHGSGSVDIEDRSNALIRQHDEPLFTFQPSRLAMRDDEATHFPPSTPRPFPATKRKEPLQPSSLTLSLRTSSHYHRSSTGQDESVSINPASPQSPQQDAQTAIVRVYLDVLSSVTAHDPILFKSLLYVGHRFIWMDCWSVFGRIPCHLLQNSGPILRSDTGSSLLFELARV